MLRRRTFPPWTRRIAPSNVFMAIAWIGMRSRSARPARKTSLFGKPALEAGRDEKARSVVALSRVPRLAGFAGSPPAAGPIQAVNRPLVRIPADRHTTTGTCEIGQTQKYAICRALQEVFSKNAGLTGCEWLNLTDCKGAALSVIGRLSKLIATTRRRSPDAFIVIKAAAIAPAVVHQRRHPNRD